MTDKELREIEERLNKKYFKHTEIYPDPTVECDICSCAGKTPKDIKHEDWCHIGVIVALLAEVKRLKELLGEYGRHQEGCNAAVGIIDGQYPCKCGYEREVESND